MTSLRRSDSTPQVAVAIVGGGPAAYTAGIYSHRAGLETLVFCGYEPGGQLMLTSEIENFPGFVHPMAGPALMNDMYAQCERIGVNIVGEHVARISRTHDQFTLWNSEQKAIAQAQTVIAATGAKAKWLGLEGEDALKGNGGVSSCAVCDGFGYKNRNVMVVGGGDTALTDAIYLAKLAHQVTIVHRRRVFRADQVLQERILALPNVKVMFDATVVRLISEQTNPLGHPLLSGVIVQDISSKTEQRLNVDGLFVAIGHTPASQWLEGVAEIDALGYVVTDSRGVPFTKVPGLFVAGDVADMRYRQAITAAGMGCMAAIEAQHYIEAHMSHRNAQHHSNVDRVRISDGDRHKELANFA